MPGPRHEQRLNAVQQAFGSLGERFQGAPPRHRGTYHVRIGDLGRTWEVRVSEHAARVSAGTSRRAPDVVIGTDSATWLALRAGTLSGIEAYARRRLYARGDLDKGIAFEGLFQRTAGRPPFMQMHEVILPGRRVSALTVGEGPDVLLLHGLGAAKSSFFDTAAALARAGYRAHAIDLPGFGDSSKPLTGLYTAGWFAQSVLETMDALRITRAHIVGNSMGGRVALEVGLTAPHRVGGLGLLAPAVAFVRRGLHPFVWALRPEMGYMPHKMHRAVVARQLRSMFADPDALDPAVADVVVDEFQRVYGSAGARYAFLSAARNIYLDRPFGEGGFYPRLANLAPPALFVWGSHDQLIPAGFRRHVARWLPEAEQVVLPNCGHVPQVERPEQTSAMLIRFLDGVGALDVPLAPVRPLRRAA